MRKIANGMAVSLMLLSVFSMFGCIRMRENIVHFSAHDSLYFNAYDTATFYLFKTNKGLDTLQIYRKVCIDNYKKWYIDQCPPEGTFEPVFYYEGLLWHDGNKEDFSVFQKKTHKGKDPVISVTLGERYADSIRDSRNLRSNGIYKDTILIDDANSHVNHYFPHSYEFEYLKWSKYKGIVGYKLSDGTIYPSDDMP
jgi:hypothetical protein